MGRAPALGLCTPCETRYGYNMVGRRRSNDYRRQRPDRTPDRHRLFSSRNDDGDLSATSEAALRVITARPRCHAAR